MWLFVSLFENHHPHKKPPLNFAQNKDKGNLQEVKILLAVLDIKDFYYSAVSIVIKTDNK